MPSRNLPIAQFTAELRAETSAAIQEHAAWAGVSLAAVIVGQHRKIESLKPKEVESFRKRYQVQKEKVQVMLAAAKESFAFEFFWANAHQ